MPEEPLLMMGAGPVPIPARVAAANGIVINHLGDTMSQIVEQVKSMSVRSFVQAGRRDADEKNPILQVALVVSGFWTPEEP